jgi:Tfp pilus assembly protein PilW
MKRMHHKGISLVEIVVSMVILSLVLIGLVNVFVLSKSYIVHSRSRVSAGELGRYFLDPLQMDVRQDTWNANNLTAGASPAALEQSIEINGVEYTPDYEISDQNTEGATLRRVKVEISWNETQP